MMATRDSRYEKSPYGNPQSNSNRVILVVVIAWIAICIAVGTLSQSGPRQHPRQKTTRAAFPDASPAIGLRTQSCSTSNCHGDLIPDPREDSIRRDEYFVWLNDPHSRAAKTLSGERSLSIFRSLGLIDENRNPLPGQSENFDRHLENCLACHETNRHLAGSTAGHNAGSQAEGVSCESCHGMATNWLSLHSRHEWKTASADQKRELISGDDLTARVQRCSVCHVGSRHGGDVNHDLIAAGHPALRFEYVWYRARLPHHWKRTREMPRPAGPSNAVQAWTVGQLVTAIASLEQLERRLTIDASSNVGTEFAEFQCFACHHDLQGPSWRQHPKRHGGQQYAPWGNWSLQLLTSLADQHGTVNAKECSLTFDRLRSALQQSTSPDTTVLRSLTVAARERLKAWLTEIARLTEPEAEQILRNVARHHPEQLISSWDQTASIVLGFASPYRDSEQVPDSLREAMNRIRFPEISDSPQSFRSGIVEPHQSAEEWIDLLRKLGDLPLP